MRQTLWIVPPTLTLLACQHPELEACRRRPAPVQVVFRVPSQVPDAKGVEKEYAAALRALLATRVTVVPEGVQPPPGAATLTVEVEAMGPGRRGANPAAVGLAVGVVVGTLSALAGNRDHVFDGFWWGAMAADAAEHDRREQEWSAGFRPTRVDATFSYSVPGSPRPVYIRDINPRDVIDRVRALGRAEAGDPVRVREEEARAFAHVVVQQLARYLEWPVRPEPSFYRAPGQKAPDPDEPLPRTAPGEPPEAQAPGRPDGDAPLP